MDLARVPIVQKEITALCRRWAKPVIIATQVLQSMIENASPTRAEATDISNAVLECADAVMLSGETSVGKYPVEAVKALAHICRTSEAYQDIRDNIRPHMETPEELVYTQAMARSVASMLDEIKTQCVVIWAQDRDSIRLLSKARIDVPVVTLTSDPVMCRQLALYYGIISFYHAAVQSYEEWVEAVELILKQNQLAQSGDKVLMMPPLSVLSKNTAYSLIFHAVSG
jgi:pyruvate kinase